MRLFVLPQLILRVCIILGVILSFSTPFQTLAQDATPEAASQEAPAPQAPGAIQISLYGNDGMPLSGSFAVSDSAGGYQEVWASGGSAWAGNVAAGTVTVTQLTGTTDYAPDGVSRYVEIPAGGTGSVSYTNAFLDTDLDGIGNSVDVCAAGTDRVDTDLDTIADACDTTPNGDNDADGIDNLSDPTPNGELPTAVPTQPVAGPTVAASPTATVVPESDVAVEVSEELVVVEDAPVTCQAAEAVSPTIASELADYPPGGLVKLSSAGWLPGQVVEILVEDDGIADAERGEWNHRATVTANESGGFTYSFNIAPWFVADYSVVATGECSKAETSFTDSVDNGTNGRCEQVFQPDVVQPGDFVMYRCVPQANGPLKLAINGATADWQWAYVFNNDPAFAKPLFGTVQWTTGTLPEKSASGGERIAYVFLSPTERVLPGGTGDLTIEMKTANGGTQYISKLIGYRAPSSIDFALTCVRPAIELAAVEVGKPATINCTLRSSSLATDASVTMATPTADRPAGWSVPSISAVSGTGTQSAPSASLYTFTVSLIPACGASGEPTAVTIKVPTVTYRGLVITGPTATPAPTVALKSTAGLSFSVKSLPVVWEQNYSLADSPRNDGSLMYQVAASGCGGWGVQVSAKPFSDGQTGEVIPASNLTLDAVGAPVTVLGTSPATAASVPASTSLAGPVQILSGTSVGTYQQALDLNMNIPGGTLAGSYTSTITVSSGSGPGTTTAASIRP